MAFSVEPHDLQSVGALQKRIEAAAPLSVRYPFSYTVWADEESRLRVADLGLLRRRRREFHAGDREAAAMAVSRLPTEGEAKELYERLVQERVLLPGEFPNCEHFKQCGLVALAADTRTLWRRADDNGGFRLFVKLLTGRTLEIDVCYAMRLEAVKEVVFAATGVPVDQQRIIFAGKSLENGRTIGDYNLSKNTTIHLLLRLRGREHMVKQLTPHPNETISVGGGGGGGGGGAQTIEARFTMAQLSAPLLRSFVNPTLSLFRIDGLYSHARMNDLPAPTLRWVAAVRDALSAQQAAPAAAAASAAAAAVAVLLAPQRVDRDSLELILQYAVDAWQLGAKLAAAAAAVRLEQRPQAGAGFDSVCLLSASAVLEPNEHYVAVAHSADRSPFDFVPAAAPAPRHPDDRETKAVAAAPVVSAAATAAAAPAPAVVDGRSRYGFHEWYVFPHQQRVRLADAAADWEQRVAATRPADLLPHEASNELWRAGDAAAFTFAQALVQTCWHFYTHG